MARIYGYLRVSTTGQDLSNQAHELVGFMAKQRLSLHEIVEETASGTKSYKDRALGPLIDKCTAGDTLVVCEVSRLGRSIIEIMEILGVCLKKGIVLRTIKENLTLDGSLNSRVYLFCFALCAEVERSLLSARTREALSARKAAGVTLGRPRGSLSKSCLTGKEAEIKAFLEKGVSQASIGKILGVSSTTLHAFIATRGLKPDKSARQLKTA